MKRIGLLGAIGALTLAMFIPASVSAHSNGTATTFGARVDKALCTNRGGQHGFGKVVLKMSAYARNDLPDEPTPNFIKILGRLDQKIDGVWVKGGLTTATTPIYPDGTPYVFPNLLGLAWQFESADHPLSRIVMRVEFWDVLPSGNVRLGKISARTAAC